MFMTCAITERLYIQEHPERARATRARWTVPGTHICGCTSTGHLNILLSAPRATKNTNGVAADLEEGEFSPAVIAVN